VYLIDTNILSATAPHRPEADILRAWLTPASGIFFSVITITEIEDGIAKLLRQGATRKAAPITAWLSDILEVYRDAILPIDTAIARHAGRLWDRARAIGHAPGLADLLIGATAEQRELTVLTRNTRHFAPLGIRTINPYT